VSVVRYLSTIQTGLNQVKNLLKLRSLTEGLLHTYGEVNGRTDGQVPFCVEGPLTHVDYGCDVDINRS
jgi:hypothetical protein